MFVQLRHERTKEFVRRKKKVIFSLLQRLTHQSLALFFNRLKSISKFPPISQLETNKENYGNKHIVRKVFEDKNKQQKRNNFSLSKIEVPQTHRIGLNIFCSGVSRVMYGKGWQQIKRASKNDKMLKRLRYVLVNLERKKTMEAWLSIQMFGVLELERSRSQLEIEDLKAKIGNKKEKLDNLEEEVIILKKSLMKKNSESISYFQFYEGQGMNLKKYSSSNISKDEVSQKEGCQSFCSIFGKPMFSSNSASKISFNQSSASNDRRDCHCNAQKKSEKYKAMNQTLKKQLQIIKTELEFSKDINEQMESQFRTHFDANESTKERYKVQKLQNELKQTQRERQMLKEKILKYQKYVVKLKMQFKTKIQEIYRKVKKNS